MKLTFLYLLLFCANFLFAEGSFEHPVQLPKDAISQITVHEPFTWVYPDDRGDTGKLCFYAENAKAKALGLNLVASVRNRTSYNLTAIRVVIENTITKKQKTITLYSGGIGHSWRTTNDQIISFEDGVYKDFQPITPPDRQHFTGDDSYFGSVGDLFKNINATPEKEESVDSFCKITAIQAWGFTPTDRIPPSQSPSFPK
jgi:hypothetical protein